MQNLDNKKTLQANGCKGLDLVGPVSTIRKY